MMTQISMKPTGWLKPDPKNPRKLPDDTDPRKEQWEKDLDRLGDDMLARGVLVPLLARLDATIIDGWRRWLAALRKGIKELPVIVTDTPETEIAGIQLATVFHKADLTGAEKWMACCGILQAHPDWQLKNLAEFLHLDPSMVTRLLSPSKCIPAWQEALAAGKVGISDCYAASKLGEVEQAELLRLKLSGASRDAIEKAGRKQRTAATSTVKVSRIKAMLPSGVSIVASGEGLTLDDLIESLGEAQREAKKAREQGLDARTFQAVLRDRAKKG